MFKKKQPDPTRRQANQPQAPASVFSYYSSRSNRSGERQPKEVAHSVPTQMAKWLRWLPSLLALIVILGCIFYTTSLSNQPKIQINNSQDTQLLRPTMFYQQATAKLLSRSIFNRSKLIIDTDKLATQLETQYPELGKVSIIIPLISHRPIVEVQPAKAVMVLSGKTGSFVIDGQGRALIKSQDASSSLRDQLVNVTDESGLVMETGKQVLPIDTVNFISEIKGQLIANHLHIDKLIFPSITNELHARIVGQPYYAKFDLQGDARQQIGAFLAAKGRLEEDKTAVSEYIDVRVPEKVFYK